MGQRLLSEIAVVVVVGSGGGGCCRWNVIVKIYRERIRTKTNIVIPNPIRLFSNNILLLVVLDL